MAKKWFERSDEQKEELYQSYIKQYEKKAVKYGANMTPMMSKRAFFMTYSEYYNDNPKNVVRSIVKDSIKTTQKQALGYTKSWNKRIDELAKIEPSKLTDVQIKQLELGKMTATAMRTKTGNASEIMDWLYAEQMWGEAVGS